MTSIQETINEYIALRDRKTNPEGTFDNAGRFYLAEKCNCCIGIRNPSRSFPYSEMKHGRTLVHVATKNNVDVKECRKLLKV